MLESPQTSGFSFINMKITAPQRDSTTDTVLVSSEYGPCNVQLCLPAHGFSLLTTVWQVMSIHYLTCLVPIVQYLAQGGKKNTGQVVIISIIAY